MSLLPHRLSPSSSGHLQALAHLASPARFRESLALARRPPLHNAALVGLQVALALQFTTELAMGFNYGLGQIALTPMALLMSSLAAPAAASAMPLARVLDTALGALIGLVFAWVFSSLQARQDLAMHHIGTRATV